MKQQKLFVTLLPLEQLKPHPLNPRPWSETYQARVHEDKVSLLIESIREHGFDPFEPIHVREVSINQYEIIMGHHRFCAARALKLKSVPCHIVGGDISSVAAALMMISRQGKSVDPWLAAEHAYALCIDQGLPQKDYAKATGYEATLVNKWISAWKVRSCTLDYPIGISSAAAISRLPCEDWEWVAKLVVEQKLLTREVNQVVTNLLTLKIPERCHAWLPPNVWHKQIALDPGYLVEEIKSWIAAFDQVQEQITQKLPDSICNPSTGEVISPSQVFIEELCKISNVPSTLQIKDIGSRILGQVSSDADTLTPLEWESSIGGIDAVIVDQRFSVMPKDWLDVVTQCLQEGGRLIVLASSLQSWHLIAQMVELGWTIHERLVWHRSPSATTVGVFTPVCDDILIFTQKLPNYFGRKELLDMPHLHRQTHNCIRIPSGKGLPKLLAKLLIAAYVPIEGKILALYPDDAGLVIVAGLLRRQAYYRCLELEKKAQIELEIVNNVGN